MVRKAKPFFYHSIFSFFQILVQRCLYCLLCLLVIELLALLIMKIIILYAFQVIHFSLLLYLILIAQADLILGNRFLQNLLLSLRESRQTCYVLLHLWLVRIKLDVRFKELLPSLQRVIQLYFLLKYLLIAKG